MRQDHPELLTTLRDVAATAVTFLDAFAQIRRERTAPPAASSPTPQTGPDEPTDAPAPQADLDDTPDASPTAIHPPDPPDSAHPIFLHPIHPIDPIPEMTPTDAVLQRIVETSGRSIAREQQLLQQRIAAREFTGSINQRLCELAELASAAIEVDGVQTLPILDALLERLQDEFSDRTGPFAAAPDIEIVR